MHVHSLNKNFDFVAYPVNLNVCRIFGVGQEVMTLVEGTEKALLFDTGLGYGNIREFCQSITDKPIVVVISHGHSDHVGGNYWFDEVYIHPADVELAQKQCYSDRKKNLGGLCVQRGYVAETDASLLVPDKAVEMKSCVGGDVFHLGGLDLEVIEMPGHTAGSIALFNRAGRYILTGDAVCRGTLLGLPGAPAKEVFRDMLRAFIEKYRGQIDYVLEGHGPCPDQFRIFDGNLDAIEGLMAGKYEGAQDEFGKIIGLPIWRIKAETDVEGFCTDGMLGNVTYIKA